MKTLFAAALALIAALSAHAQRWTPDAGTRPYAIEIVERIANRPDKVTRAEFDLVTDGKGGAHAVVRGVTLAEGGPAKPLEPDPACLAALATQPGEIARVPLAPVTPATAASLSFIPACVEPDLFGPLGEIFRVMEIQFSPQFGLEKLKRAGDSQRFPAFASHLDRPTMKLDLESAGGVTRLAKLEKDRATIEWAPDPMYATVILRNAMPGIDMKAEGTVRIAFRVAIDRGTGALLEAETIEDNALLMADIKDAPPIRVEIARTVTVRPR